MAKGFKHKKRHTAPNGPGPGRPRKPAIAKKAKGLAGPALHESLAEKLWSPTYDALIREELAEHPELAGMVRGAVGQPGRASATQVELVESAATGIVAQIRRLRNKRDIPLVVAARSLSWLMAMARTKQWNEERRARRLLDRRVAMKILERMTALAPPPAFAVNPLVKLGFVDQTYMQNYHYGSRRHVRVEVALGSSNIAAPLLASARLASLLLSLAARTAAATAAASSTTFVSKKPRNSMTFVGPRVLCGANGSPSSSSS